jgi:general secretion pathway protein D
LDEDAARYLGVDYTANGVGTAVGSASVGLGARGNVDSSGTTTQTSGPASFGAAFQAQLYATIEHGDGRILDTPRILAVNGTPAQILTGEALPIISTTTTLGSTAYQQSSVNYIAVGVNLQIEPRISDDGFVTSHVFAEVSSVGQYVSGGVGEPPIPQVELRQVTTMATVADGTPFVIGGLLKDEEIQSLSKLPGIGDLPIIGALFRNQSRTVTKQNLFIIITPHVIHRAAGPNMEVPYQSLPRPTVPGPVPYGTPHP